MVDVAKLLSSLKLPPSVFFGLALASAIVLFAPESVIAALGLGPLIVAYRPWIGVTFLVSLAVFLSLTLARLGALLGPALLERWNERQWRKELAVLSPPEKRVLAEYVRENTTTCSHHVSDGVVGGLVAKGILFRASNFGHPGSTSFDYNLQPWAWRHLMKHPELVDAPARGAAVVTSN
jgi:hypothetical protein